MKNSYYFLFTVIVVFGTVLFSCSQDNDLSNKEDQQANYATRAGDLTPMELLGKEIFFDKISVPRNMSCANCHGAKVGFTGPKPGINAHGAVYPGAVAQNFGNRKPPSAAYATFSPILHINGEGIFEGGNFWDGRATGEVLGSPSADQAMGPFLNVNEHNVPDKETVLQIISNAKYISLWEVVWGEPLSYSNEAEIELNYGRVALSIAEYEASSEVNQFTSKFDYYLAGEVELTPLEMQGLNLFNNEGKCALCHPSDGINPLFTDFTYDNLGTPKNPENPVYDYDPGFIDYGLGGYLSTLEITRPDWFALANENMGKQKVPTLRNVDKRPGKNFKKAYTHNGVFKSLKEVVHFYNTRDVEEWPDPEVPNNINSDELGNLGLTEAEEDAIVAFMMTLSDGYDLD